MKKKIMCLFLVLLMLLVMVAPGLAVDTLSQEIPFQTSYTVPMHVTIAEQDIHVFDARIQASGKVTGQTANVEWHSVSIQNVAAGVTNVTIDTLTLHQNKSGDPQVVFGVSFISSGAGVVTSWNLAAIPPGSLDAPIEFQEDFNLEPYVLTQRQLPEALTPEGYKMFMEMILEYSEHLH